MQHFFSLKGYKKWEWFRAIYFFPNACVRLLYNNNKKRTIAQQLITTDTGGCPKTP